MPYKLNIDKTVRTWSPVEGVEFQYRQATRTDSFKVLFDTTNKDGQSEFAFRIVPLLARCITGIGGLNDAKDTPIPWPDDLEFRAGVLNACPEDWIVGLYKRVNETAEAATESGKD